MTGAGTSRCIASSTVQRPSPESSTNPLIVVRSASFSKARAASSLSQERTTLPWFHRLAMLHRLSLRSEEHTSELQSQSNLVCRLLLEKKNKPAISRFVILDAPCEYSWFSKSRALT